MSERLSVSVRLLAATSSLLVACALPQAARAEDPKPVQRRATLDTSTLKAHPKLSREKVPSAETLAIAELPVLLPDVPALLEVAKPTAERDWYGVSMTRDGVNVYVSGRRTSFDVPGIEANRTPRAEPALTRNELTVHVSFNRFGAAYSIAVECARPSEDERCTKDDYALGLFRAMAAVEVRP